MDRTGLLKIGIVEYLGLESVNTEFNIACAPYLFEDQIVDDDWPHLLSLINYMQDYKKTAVVYGFDDKGDDYTREVPFCDTRKTDNKEKFAPEDALRPDTEQGL